MLVRIHSKDSSAPLGSNASKGWVVRIQKGSTFYDPVSGTYIARNAHKLTSPHYDPIKVNNAHIPMDLE